MVTRLDGQPPTFHVWRLPEVEPEHTLTFPQRTAAMVLGEKLLTLNLDTAEPGTRRTIPSQLRSLDGTIIQDLGLWRPRGPVRIAVDPTGSWLYSLQEGQVLQQRIGDLASPGRVIGVHEEAVNVSARPWSERVVTSDAKGEVRIWDTTNARLERTLQSAAGAEIIALGSSGRYLSTSPTWQNLPPGTPALFLLDLDAPQGSEPIPLLGPVHSALLAMEFSSDGSWLRTTHNGMVVLWNLKVPRALVLDRQVPLGNTVAFTTSSEFFVASDDGLLRRYVLSPSAENEAPVIWSRPGAAIGCDLQVSVDGRTAVATARFSGIIFAIRLYGAEAATYELEREPEEVLWSMPIALDPSGRFVAATVLHPRDPSKNELRILDLTTGEERSLETQPETGRGCEEPGSGNQGLAVPAWLADGRLVTDGDAGLLLWDLESGKRKPLHPGRRAHPSAMLSLLPIPRSQEILRFVPAHGDGETSSLSVFDLASGTMNEISSRGNQLTNCAVDASGMVLATVDREGTIQVGPLRGGEPHLLSRKEGVFGLAISPDGRSLVSTGDDGTLRLWPMPDLAKPPLHTLPHDELLAKLKSLTNLRAVRDPESSTGWKIEVGPFPGWVEVPEW
jgi:WD40 repeat protein